MPATAQLPAGLQDRKKSGSCGAAAQHRYLQLKEWRLHWMVLRLEQQQCLLALFLPSSPHLRKPRQLWGAMRWLQTQPSKTLPDRVATRQ